MLSIYERDSEYVCNTVNLRALESTTILVTGSTGLIGKNLIYSISRWNQFHAINPILVLALVRDQQKATDLFGNHSWLKLVNGDVQTADLSGIHPDYIIHAASQTASRAFVDNPVETIFTAIDGTRNLLECARINDIKRFIYLSTMEVYGTPSDDHLIDENHLTNLNTMDVRSCYPISKRMCENICISYQSEYSVPINVLRLTQTFGPGVKYNDQRVFAEFARCVIENRDIVLKTTGETKRKYLYTADAVSAILTVMLSEQVGKVYNVANDDTYCTIYQMAELVSKEIASEKIAVHIELDDINKYGYSKQLHMNLDTEQIRSLGWAPHFSMNEMFNSLISSMQSIT